MPDVRDSSGPASRCGTRSTPSGAREVSHGPSRRDLSLGQLDWLRGPGTHAQHAHHAHLDLWQGTWKDLGLESGSRPAQHTQATRIKKEASSLLRFDCLIMLWVFSPSTPSTWVGGSRLDLTLDPSRPSQERFPSSLLHLQPPPAPPTPARPTPLSTAATARASVWPAAKVSETRSAKEKPPVRPAWPRK